MTALGSEDTFLTTYFQPFYNLHSHRLQGLEALARRHDGQHGHLDLPAGFFTAAERSGAMRDIDLWILQDSLAHMSRWHRSEARPELILSVNLSWESITHPDVVSDVSGALERHGVPSDRLLVDIDTEKFRRLRSADAGVIAGLRRLQETGISFCLDGFTADDLDLLPDAVAAPADIIKLHPRQLAVDAREQLAQVATTIEAAGLPVVAAGVETREQLGLVQALGFEWAQGFLLGEPMAADRAGVHPLLLPSA